MLRQQADDLWTLDYELRMPGGVPFPTRMTVVRERAGSLVLISPVPIDDALAAQLAALGSVNTLVAPNLLHHLHLPAAHRRYPHAQLLGPLGLRAKQPGLPLADLSGTGLAAYADSLAVQLIAGAPKLCEHVFLHRPSRTLVVTELVFNVVRPPAWQTGLLLWFTGTRGRLAQSRVWSFMIEDAAAARASCERVMAWDFDRLIVAHGEVIASGAKPLLGAALTRTGPGSTQ